ncbi:MAG: DsrE family protein [Acidiferrobacter sp.]
MRESDGPRLSDEFLNAFVDNQIDSDEKSRAYPLINADEGLNRQVCELRKISDLVRFAYETPPAPQKSLLQNRDFRARLSPFVASLVLIIGVTLGWSLRALWAPLGVVAPATTTIATTSGPTTKVLFHLDNGDRAHMRQVLEEAQHLLARYQADHRLAKVEILADGPGLALLRQHMSPFATQIARLQTRYPNLIFAACQDTINRLERRKGIDPHLLPQAVIVPSAIAEIVRLQHHGWTYIRV